MNTYVLMSEICDKLGYIRAQFMAESIALATNKLAEEKLGIVKDSAEERYRNLYCIWIARLGLKSNTRFQWLDVDLSEDCINKYGYGIVLNAATIYHKVKVSREYTLVPDYDFESFLKDIEKFLPNAKPSAFERYARPRLATSPKVAEQIRIRANTLSEMQIGKFNHINKVRESRGLKPFTVEQYKKKIR